MEEIMRYTAYLEEAKDNLNDGETKTILFTSFQWLGRLTTRKVSRLFSVQVWR